MEQIGKSFVDFVSQYGYDRVLSVLGRHMRDFLNGELITVFPLIYAINFLQKFMKVTDLASFVDLCG